MISLNNIFSLDDYVYNEKNEFFKPLFQNEYIRIEKIVSEGHCSPPDFWYDQEENEWVLLLQGKAKLKFQNTNEIIELNPGEFILIEPHIKHRVEWTTPNEKTIWLAFFFK
ncbi:MAG: cupin domain-containing protein [Ignavibacteria bacterium]|nr:cupin domain-containing protein [Ignavibacteria bacterium]